MTTNIAVAGSIAYDYIMFYDGFFEDSILPDKIKNLNVSFLTKNAEVFFGGVSPNISYSCKLMGLNPFIFGVIGEDFHKYFTWLKKNKISTKYIVKHDSLLTAAGYMLADNRQNQLSFFSLGAMSDLTKSMDFGSITNKDVSLAIISPEIPERMISYVRSAQKKKIPYIFDPGQQTNVLSAEACWEAIEKSMGIIVNEYEFMLLLSKLNIKEDKILNKVRFLVKTVAENGSYLYTKESKKPVHIPAYRHKKVTDPTGCGDAFRGGFIKGLTENKDLAKCCEMGNTVASFCILEKGTQNYCFDNAQFLDRLKKTYK